MIVVRTAVVPTARAVAWIPLAVAMAVGTAFVANAARRSWHDASAMSGALAYAALALATATGFVVEDTASETTAPVPIPLSVRRAVRLVLCTAGVGVAWVVLVWIASARGADLPAATLTLHLAAESALVVALAATLARRGFTGIGQRLVPAMFAFRLVVTWLPERFALSGIEPGSAGWTGMQLRWTGLLLLALVVLAVETRDPARREPIARPRATGR